MNVRTLTLGSALTRPMPKLSGIASRIATWIQIARERRQLSGLDRTMLADIGLTEHQASFESRRPFWDTTLR